MAKIITQLILFILSTAQQSSSTVHQNGLSPRFQYFDIELLSYMAEAKSGNVLLSPASLKSTLFMLLEGSQGKTAHEMKMALRLSPDVQEMRQQLNVYLTALQSNDTGVSLENANGIFISDKLSTKKQFSQVLQEVYQSQLTAVNFSDPELAAGDINNWVSKKTHGLVPELVEPANVSPTSSLMVLNAIYFKGSWKKAFNPKLTRQRCFYRGDVCTLTPTMQLHAGLRYGFIEDLRAHAVELPYEGTRFSALVLVPHDRDGCVTVIRDLPHVSLARVMTSLEHTDVELYLPKFSVDFNEELVPALKDIKISRLFTSSAELSGMIEGDSRGARVDSVVQRVRVQVTETGTEAAAATGAVVIPLIGSNAFRLKVDRPFLFFIRDNQSGAILFEGKIEDPTLTS